MKRAGKRKWSKRESGSGALPQPRTTENLLTLMGITAFEPPDYRVNFLPLFISDEGSQPDLYCQI